MALVRSPERSWFIQSLPNVKLDLDIVQTKHPGQVSSLLNQNSGVWSIFVFVRFDLVIYILS